MINEWGQRAKAAISRADKGCLRTKKLNKTQKDKACPWMKKNKNWGRVAGKVETWQVNKLLNFDRQLMKTLFNL